MGRTRMVDVSEDPHLTDELWKKLEPMIPVPEPANWEDDHHTRLEPVWRVCCLY
jgi:hypothetical protein